MSYKIKKLIYGPVIISITLLEENYSYIVSFYLVNYNSISEIVFSIRIDFPMTKQSRYNIQFFLFDELARYYITLKQKKNFQ